MSTLDEWQSRAPAAKPAGRTSRAARDLRRQLQAVKTALAAHASALDPLLPDALADSPYGMAPGHCAFFDRTVVEERKRSAMRAKEDLVVAELDRALKLGDTRKLARAPEQWKLAALREDFPHFAPALELVEQRCALARLSPAMTFSLPPVLLSGPPGVGKTAFVERLAQCLGQSFRRVDVAAATAGFVLSGSHASWSGSRAGVVWELLQSPSASGVMMLDEVDKAADSRYPVLGPLLALLERSSARHFSDEFVQIAINAAHISWMATCNDSSRIDSALRSRFTEVEIARPSPVQMLAIARSIYKGLRETESWTRAFDRELPADVLEVLAAVTPRELIRVIEQACARAAADGRCSVQPANVLVPPREVDVRRIGFL